MWLLSSDVFEVFRAKSVDYAPSKEEVSAFADAFEDDCLLISGSTAIIRVSGVLTDAPNFFAELFGGGNTTYPSLLSAITKANTDTNVEAIEMVFNSPGGVASAQWVAVIDAVAASLKPITAVVQSQAQSAAYGIASQAEKIVVQNRLSLVGSVGTVKEIFSSDRFIQIANTQSPRKRPDVRTEEGREMVRKELDSVHAIFVDAIARGRGTTEDDVNLNFGRGASVLAEQALARGMIDVIAQANRPKRRDRPREAVVMDLEEFKSNYPDVYQKALSVGASEELDRVQAHLIMGEKSGAMSTAIDAINKGAGMTASLQATYMAAGMNRADIADRISDNPPAIVPELTDTDAQQKAVASQIEQHFGIVQ